MSARAFKWLPVIVVFFVGIHLCGAEESATKDADKLLDRAKAQYVLTTEGAHPFHAALEVTPQKNASSDEHGRIELFWAAPSRYFLVADTPMFHQSRVVDGAQVHEVDDGDYYPIWLQQSVNVLLDPLGRASTIYGHNNGAADRPYFADLCLERDERHNNVLDAANYVRICFNKAAGVQLNIVQDYTHGVEFSDFHDFHGKSIARTYTLLSRDDRWHEGKVVTLEDWTPDPAKLAVVEPTPVANRIQTVQISSVAATSLIASEPHDVSWPTVREGKTEGNLVVHVVTDRIGKIREASPDESDNQGLMSAASAIALQYRFKPYLVDNVPEQVEMPLVIHFKTTIASALPVMDDQWLRDNVKGCNLPTTISKNGTHGDTLDLMLRIGADGTLQGMGSPNQAFAGALFKTFASCKLPPVLQDGRPTEYFAHLTLKIQ